MSERTYTSWWVPFEIGLSAQKDMPMVTFFEYKCILAKLFRILATFKISW